MKKKPEEFEQLLSDALAVLQINLSMWSYKDEQSMFELFGRIEKAGVKVNKKLFDDLLTNRDRCLNMK